MRFPRFAILLASFTSCAFALAFGCADNTPSFPFPMGGPPNGHGAGTGAGGSPEAGPGIDLCQCALGFAQMASAACNESVIMQGQACNASESLCAAAPTCAADAKCVGSCITDAGADASCMSACIASATVQYRHYLDCICLECKTTCTSTETCP
jgi:hypothetical protein